MSKLLTEKQIEKKLTKLSAWDINKKRTELSKTFTSTSFVDGLAFVARIAVHAELLNHHPEITFSFNKVRVSLTTHACKGLTQKDFDLAERIDTLTR